MNPTKLKGYAASISRATGVVEPTLLKRIEQVMREDIFHSTLDWQSRKVFNAGAREALDLIRYMDSQEGRRAVEKRKAEMMADTSGNPFNDSPKGRRLAAKYR